MDSTAEFAQLQWRFVDQTQWRYEVIRPLVLFADRTAAQRAQETATHPETVRTLHRRLKGPSQNKFAKFSLWFSYPMPKRRVLYTRGHAIFGRER